MAPVLGHLLRAVQPRGAFAIWTPGAAGDAVRMLLDAGLRLEPFPILMCWDAPLTDWTRYLPISPGTPLGTSPDRPAGHRTGPWSGVRMHRWSRLPVSWTGGSLRTTWLSLPCPRTEPCQPDPTRDRVG